MELENYGIDLSTLQKMYSEWKSGTHSKSAIERRYLGKATHHGKLFTKLVREYLGVETETASSLRMEVERLRSLLLQHGIDPDSNMEITKLFETEEE